MIAIPAVELRDASFARAARGEGAAAHGSGDPALAARALADLGFTRIQLEARPGMMHLDAESPAVEDILMRTDARIQVAEANTGSDVERLLRTGADSVVVGARSIDEPEWLAHIANLYPSSIVVATDLRDRRVVRQGWVRTLPVDIFDLLDEVNALPIAGLLVSGIQVGGPTRAADLSLVEDIAEQSRSPVLVSTRISTLDDLRALEHRGVAAVVLRADQLAGTIDSRIVAREFGG